VERGICPMAASYVMLCYDVSDVIALSTVARHSNYQRATIKLFFKLLAMYTYNILAVSQLTRNVLSVITLNEI